MDQTPEDIASDAANVQAALQGDHAAFRRLVEKYQSYIFNLCWRVTLHEQDAADLTQEAFLKLYRHLGDYKPGQKLSNWLYTIALNDCRKHLRRKKIVRFLSFSPEGTELELPAPGPSADSQARGTQARDLMDRMVVSLPGPLREVFVLRYLEDLSDEEIVKITGLGLENVRVRVHRARKFLWERFGDSLKGIL